MQRALVLGQIGVLLHAVGHLFRFGLGLLGHIAAGQVSTQRRWMAAHERQQLAFFLVKHKQFFGQRRLVAEHVDQEAQRAQVVAQVLESTRCAGLCFVDLGVQNRIDRGPHARHGLHRLIQPEHREHAAHLRQLRDGHMQATLFHWRTEKLIQRFFRLAQRHLELAHHTAHGLAVAHAPVKLLYPGIQRLPMGAREHGFQALGQRLGALRHLFVVGIEIFESGFQIQGGGGHFHRQLRTHTRCIAGGLIGGLDQRMRQQSARWVQLEQTVGNQPDLVLHLASPAGVSAREQRPGFFGSVNAFARLHQQGGVVETQRGSVVVGHGNRIESEGITHRAQPGRFVGGSRRGLGTEKQQIAQQGFRYLGLALSKRGELQQHAGGRALHIHICW